MKKSSSSLSAIANSQVIDYEFLDKNQLSPLAIQGDEEIIVGGIMSFRGPRENREGYLEAQFVGVKNSQNGMMQLYPLKSCLDKVDISNFKENER